MKFYVNWRSSLGSIKKNRKRSLLTMFGIIIGIAAVIAILSLGRGFEKDTIKSLTNNDSDKVEIQINFTPNNDGLYSSNLGFFSDRDITLLKTVSGVENVDYPQQEMSSIYKEITIKDKQESKQIELVDATEKELLYGRNLTTLDNETQNKVALIDSITAQGLFDAENKAIGKGIELNGQIFKIVGVYQGEEMTSMFSLPESNIQLPKKTYTYYFEPEKNNYSLTMTIASGGTPSEVTTEAIDLLKKDGSMHDFGEYQVFDTAMLTDGIGQILSTITYFISAVAGISLFIAGVGVMNMMYISVSERTKEIGIRRALGATRRSIKMQFLLEGMTLTLVGGIIGYIFGILFAYAIGSLIDVSVSIDFFTVALAIGVSSGIGLIFSVMPASEASKKDLIDILR
ncbi:ABC transporter permease [Enterococcus phoeniculicola]|jgi:putative ABC transport system permease protein|uniref:ABC transporter permease n=1 Tax=Enterococcus phoeniculicola ATCC BAA-412 TaxID=1158610 RepID=R3W4A2_9ENTE|nr:ABC transporter permease [Enterococcus phoeniculicola]EOL42351.1 hypothetical protein UC3_02703 [Enterococcus phoeniculicola ATCC BAA-412]EOT79370.1 hypothetical protein I589_00878 [Enterococcus phoeniculicola ATCC BAA-412]